MPSLALDGAGSCCGQVEDKNLNGLVERLDEHNENRKEVQEKLHRMCEGWRKEIDEPRKEESDQIEKLSAKEKSILQNALVNSPEDGKTIM